MALKLRDRYATRANEPSTDYPTGSFKNKSSPVAVDGTPLEKDWANDLIGSRDAILKRAGVIASGDIETADVSDVLNAIEILIAEVSSQLIGIDQSWQDLTATRAALEDYTNEGVKPITVNIFSTQDVPGYNLIVDGVTVATNNSEPGVGMTLSVIIPPGSVYSYTGPFQRWCELR